MILMSMKNMMVKVAICWVLNIFLIIIIIRSENLLNLKIIQKRCTFIN